ncbi:MAG: hypothetical protein C0478_02450 [Planctomyces sp.]|nr:hypothetical protein [Planctomyces sp.]
MPNTRAGDGPLSVAITFLLLGIGYSFPVLLWPQINSSLAVKSAGTMNLYTLTAWGGLAHFLYAWRGQRRALLSGAPISSPAVWKPLITFMLALCGVLLILAMIRQVTPVRLFDGIVWFYFIPHFLKAERIFQKSAPLRRGDVALLLMSFAYFSIIVLAHEFWAQHEVAAFLIGMAFIAILLISGGIAALKDSQRAPIILMATFLLGESLVWSGYARYMTPTFADGIYGFHVAGASFYHYLRAYAFGISQSAANAGRSISRDMLLQLPAILLVNGIIVVLGTMIGYSGIAETIPIAHGLFAPQFFTVWVAWHLVASDLFPPIRQWSRRQMLALQPA